MSRKRYLIIGDGAAGTTAAQYVRKADADALIAIYSDDPNPAYFRAALTNYLLGELREEQIWAVPASFYNDMQINRVLARVAHVDPAKSEIWLASGGRAEPYDALLIAAGSRARPPTFEGGFLPGIMTMRTLQDVRRVLDLIRLHGLRNATVIGGGPLGLEWAHGLHTRGVHCTIIMRDQRFLPGAMDEVASDLLLARLRHAGVEVRVGTELRAAMPGRDGRVAAVHTTQGETIACELVGCAIGVICNTEFLQGGLQLGKTSGVIIDKSMRTSVKNIFAAGDVAELDGKLLQLWEPARLQGRVAAASMTGGVAAFTPGVHYFATRLFDLDFCSLGTMRPDSTVEELVDYPKNTGRISYRKLLIKEGKLVGALMLGEREERVRQRGRLFKRLIDERVDIKEVRASLLDPTFDLNGWMQTNVLTEKPKPGRGTIGMQAVGIMKGTHVLNMAAMPPLPEIGIAAAAPPPPQAGLPVLPALAKMKGTQLVPSMDSAALTAMAATMAAAPAQRGAYLESQGQRWELSAVEVTIGRDPGASITIPDPNVGHVHAQISRHGSDHYVRDLGSRIGTWVNGAAVNVPFKLRPGDKIRLGSTDFVFRIEGAPLITQAPISEAEGSRRPHLEVRAGQSLGLRFALAESPVIIGRDQQATIRLDDYSVAARHASFREVNGQWWIADLQSASGTKKNGTRLGHGQEVAISDGDVIELGEAVLAFSNNPIRGGSLHSPDSLSRQQQQPQRQHSAPPSAQARPKRARVVVRSGSAQGRAFELGEISVVGAQPGACHVLLADPMIAPQHVEISRRADGYYVRDLGSQLGSWRQGQPLHQPARLVTGDTIAMGQHVMMIFEEEP
jgi:NADPH-dependent 2,4-dienoyl-CoA reductase/sulfur reductase-like enzyme/pSer/pThr/pTyr-binding forkhead associated (FHA) protein